MNRWPTVATLAVAAGVSQSFGRFTYALLFTDIRDAFELSNTVAGAIGSLNLVAYLVGSAVVSYTVGRIGLANTARTGLTLVAVVLGVLAWSPTVAVLVIAVAAAGIGSSGVWVTVPVIATQTLGAARRGTAIGWTTGGVGAGMVAAAAIDGLTATWRATYGVEFVVGIVAVAALIAATRSTAARSTATSSPARRNTAAREADVPDVAAETTDAAEATAPAAPTEPDEPPLGPFAALRSVPRWLSLIVTYGAYAAAISLCVTFTVALLTEDAGLADATANLSFSLLGAGGIPGGPLFGVLADRIGRRTSIITGLALSICSLAAIASGAGALALAGSAGFGVAFSGVLVAIVAHMSDHLEGAALGSAYGLATIVFGAGLAVGPQVGGLLADAFGSFRPAFVLAMAFCAAGIVLTARPDRTTSRPR